MEKGHFNIAAIKFEGGSQLYDYENYIEGLHKGQLVVCPVRGGYGYAIGEVQRLKHTSKYPRLKKLTQVVE